MAALKAGDVVVADFPGITGIKRRPAVVVSTDAYHSHRPDVLLPRHYDEPRGCRDTDGLRSQ